MELPAEFDEYYSKTPLSPVFNGANGIFPIMLRANDGTTKTIYLTSSDYGKTWTYSEKFNLARTWAEALKTGDGKPRYDIMSAGMQAEYRERQETINVDADNYTIHHTGPQVDYYEIAMNESGAVVTYWYNDAYGNRYKGMEHLTFGEENRWVVVTGCKTEAAFTDQKLYDQKLPVLTLREDQIIYEEKADGITQGFYRSYEDSEVGNEFYSYLSIRGIKYDLGYAGYDADGGGYHSMLCTLTDIDSETPVYQQVRIYGLTALETSYITIRNNVPYLIYNMPGTGSQYDLDDDGDAETVSNTGTSLFPEDFIYEWDVQNGTVSLLPLTEALGCDIASYDADDNLIRAYTFKYDDNGGISEPPIEGPSYRYARGGLVQAGGAA
jgi:hypothetical protein